ncbi:MAG: transcription antitermination factor NusB [Bacilli bacterium]|nr:transcription antitermination factor NusB [Bacilli bacterium]
MALTRSELRKKIMIILYQIDILKGNNVSYDIEEVMKDNIETENEFVKTIVYGVETYKEQIDEIANKYMVDWDINRLDKTGAMILRMGIFELMYTDTPQIVVINEAIELAKQYSDDKVKNIINAVLDKIKKSL